MVIRIAHNVELDAVQRVGFVLRAWRQVVVLGRRFFQLDLKHKANVR